MAKNNPVVLEPTYVHPPLYLTEALWISDTAPDRMPLAPISGGGGFGFGGWGLDAGRPRGTSPPRVIDTHELAPSRVLDIERKGIEQDHDAKYAASLQALPAQIAQQRSSITEAASASATTALGQLKEEQRRLTELISDTRRGYLQDLPDAVSFYGAPSFYKRTDSMMTRIYDPGVFTEKGEAFANELYSRLNRSADGSYRLHLKASALAVHAADLAPLAAALDRIELEEPGINLPEVVTRRLGQIHVERAIQFDGLPSFLQHEIVSTVGLEGQQLTDNLAAHLAAAQSLIAAKHQAIPAFSSSNPKITSPLSKPQAEALQHLVDEQRNRRAGPLWKDYHLAMSLTESIRFLERYASATQNLLERTQVAEQLLATHANEQSALLEAQAAAEQAAQQQAEAEAARRKAQAELRAKEQAFIHKWVPGELQAIERPREERLAKKAQRKALAERKAREAAEKAEMLRLRREQAQQAKEAARAARAAQRVEAERKVKDALAERQAKKAARKLAAERRADEARQQAEAMRKQQHEERVRRTYAYPARDAASLPLVLPIGSASFGNLSTAYAGLQAAIRTAIASVLATGTTALVATMSLAWPSSLGNSDRQYLIGIPLRDLAPPEGPDLEALALLAPQLDLSYLLSGSEEGTDLKLHIIAGRASVPVRAARWDSVRGVYSVALENPQRTLTWTPAGPPGAEGGGPTGFPQVPEGVIVYTGSSLNPVTPEAESYPALDLLDQERLIVTFPADSGLPPLLVVLNSPRYQAGTGTGESAALPGPWPGEAARVDGAPLPSRIADIHRGKPFKNFDAFRRSIWKSIANDLELAKNFDDRSLRRMKRGLAPLVDDRDIYMSQITYVLHHVTPISEGGGVYDMSNIRVVIPPLHNRIHYGKKP
ncbi:S-type pyocin domain-containing protein [Pseudomonas putida]|uniref:S-type pyocin domain-containing protein n=1 Tax=Pseudomonas putida TaxID=303 RepID=UPI0018E6923C|nr:S-type pyocin domain-containing protein [Pseudomonas putida]MBI6925005.1 S-type pyocin domain-containing protein [Pseudomonas putida]